MQNLTHQRIAIAAPRGFAKSYYSSYFYPLYLLLERPGVQIQIISATGALAEEWAFKIRNQIEFNPTIRAFYGDLVGDRWRNDDFTLTNGSCLKAKGAGKQLRGFRPDVVIGDDLETEEMVASAEQRRKFDHWFWSDLTGMLLSHGQLVVVGTVLHPDSFLGEMLRHGKAGWKTRFYQAVQPNGQSLWPEQWPIEVLNQRREEMGSYLFQQEYMNDPIPDEFRTFQEKWIRYYDKVPEGLTYFTTVDPAIEIGDRNDYTAIVTCGIDQQENIYVVETINKQLLPSETVDAIFDVYRRWKPATIGVESVGFSKMLKLDVDREKLRRKEYPLVVELKSEGVRKDLRIQSLQPWFEAGKVYIKQDMEELKTQLLRFPSLRCHDDIIDALAYQLKIFRASPRQAMSVNPLSFIAQVEKARQEFNPHNRFAGDRRFWGNHRIRGN